LRCIEDASQLPGVNQHLSVDAVCKSTLSDANALFDPSHLLGLMADLRAHLPNLAQMDRTLDHLLDLPARVIAELYRYRWQIELFFRWLKVHASFGHLSSHGRNGVTLGFYIATIATLHLC